MIHRCALIPALSLAYAAYCVPHATAASLKSYETRYYVLHTDLPADVVREVDVRLTAMAAMYADRTRGFAGQITRRFPFYLFRDVRDFLAAGGLPGSAGIFDGEKLMAVAGERLTAESWRLIQHEGFHQFVRNVIRGDFPIWVNEGMAEYFGEAIYTGDGFVTGVIPASRAERIKAWIGGGHALSVKGMMTLSHEAWNVNLNLINYDQAWSMIQFLAHADGGRYQKPLNAFITAVSRGQNWEAAWNGSFGSGTREFERQWKDYWSELPPEPTSDLYAQACVATLTSFYARAFSQRQVFSSAAAFFEAGRAGELKADKSDWLPRSLLDRELRRAPQLGSWQVRKRAGYELVCTLEDGAEVVGTFKIEARRVKPGSVRAEVRRRP